MNKTIALGIALALGLAVPAFAQQDPIKVGTIFPLSGGAGPDGQSVTNAVKLAVEQLNQAGGLLGRKIVLVSKDDESTPAVGVSRANEMIAEKVDVVIEGCDISGWGRIAKDGWGVDYDSAVSSKFKPLTR